MPKDMFKGILQRLDEDNKQTLGNLSIFFGTKKVFEAASLELPWLDNDTDVSCIPVGDYVCTRRHSVKYGWHWKVTEKNGDEVRGRSFILIHIGNFHRDTRGCIILGVDHIDIDNDGYKDVTSSGATMRHLNNVMDEQQFSLKVVDMVETF